MGEWAGQDRKEVSEAKVPARVFERTRESVPDGSVSNDPGSPGIAPKACRKLRGTDTE